MGQTLDVLELLPGNRLLVGTVDEDYGSLLRK